MNKNTNDLRSAFSKSLYAVGALSLVLSGLGVGHAQDSTSTAVPLELTELTICRGVENGRAIDPTDSFSTNSERIYALVRVKNPQRKETRVFVAFAKADGEGVVGRGLAIAPQWRVRTVARTSSRHLLAGAYKVVVRDADGHVLGERPFTVH